jgi:hypothetical protein
MLGALWKFVKPEDPLPGEADELSKLRFWAAVGIVVVSIASAMSVLQASVYDEHGSQDDAVYRQQLVTQQQSDRSREEAVAQDLALFGSYEQHALHARDLQRQAAALTANPRLAATLATRAEGERAVAVALLTGFRVPLSAAASRSGLYDPSASYRIQSTLPSVLEDDLDPRQHRLEARSNRNRGVEMTGAAALFLAALVFFTFSQIFARAKKAIDPDAHPSEQAAVSDVARRRAHRLFAIGAVCALSATIFALTVVA